MSGPAHPEYDATKPPARPKPADRPDGVWVSRKYCHYGPTTCGPRGENGSRICTADMMKQYCLNDWALLKKDGSYSRYSRFLRF